MALFGKKKKIEEQSNSPVNNNANSNISDEMKIILAAREEDKQEKQARAEERLEAQKEAIKQEDKLEEQARIAAEMILSEEFAPKGMTFFTVVDELPVSSNPETEGNIIVRGNVRGTVKKDSDVFVYQGGSDKYKVRIERIRNDDREFVDSVTNARCELEITRGDIPLPTDPDQDASRPVDRFAVITDAEGIEDTKDPTSKGMAFAGNPRTIALLCEYGRYGKDSDFFTAAMNSIITAELVTPAKITPVKNGKSNIGFIGVSSKTNPDKSYLPVFTDNRLAVRAINKSFAKQGGPEQRLTLNFAQIASIARDEHHDGFLINPGGPVTITIPPNLINKMVETELFKKRFGAGIASASAVVSDTDSRIDNFIANAPNIPGAQQILIFNPSDTPEFAAIEDAVKKYCGAHSDISRVLILMTAPANNRNEKSYFCIMDCPDGPFEKECNGLAEAIKPYIKGIKKIQFQQFSKMNKKGFPEKVTWLYSKLPQ